MRFWIFKVTEHSVYPDRPGYEYVYDNTHSVKVASGDEFLYLEKSQGSYALTGAGRVARVGRRGAKQRERRNARVDRIFTAQLDDVIWFSTPFELATHKKAGRSNRQKVRLPDDLNGFGWSISMPQIGEELFTRLLDAAIVSGVQEESDALKESEAFLVEDAWSVVRRRRRMHAFRTLVLARHDHTCVVCGTTYRPVLDAAHIRSYSSDPAQRANPANGICLCSFCHAAFDSRDITIFPDGHVESCSGLNDTVARTHFTTVCPETRRERLRGVDPAFLLERVGC